MKKLSKPMLAIFLSVTILISTYSITFSMDDGDPYGTCAMPKYQVVK